METRTWRQVQVDDSLSNVGEERSHGELVGMDGRRGVAERLEHIGWDNLLERLESQQSVWRERIHT